MGRFQDQKILFNALSNNVKAAFKIIEIIQEVNVSASNCQIPENSRSWLVSLFTAHDNVTTIDRFETRKFCFLGTVTVKMLVVW